MNKKIKLKVINNCGCKKKIIIIKRFNNYNIANKKFNINILTSKICNKVGIFY